MILAVPARASTLGKAFSFNSRDSCDQPVSKRVFSLLLRTPLIEAAQRFA
jgi:hypothetical protein